MSSTRFSLDYPKPSTKIGKFALFLLARVRATGSPCVDARQFLREHSIGASTASRMCHDLRIRYKFYVAHSTEPYHYDCATTWPSWSHGPGGSKVWHVDPRVYVVRPAQREFLVQPSHGTLLYEIWRHIKTNREPRTHIVNFTGLYKRVEGGAKPVQRKFGVLTKRYGFTFVHTDKPNCYVVEKKVNRILTPEHRITVLPEHKEPRAPQKLWWEHDPSEAYDADFFKQDD